MQAVGPFGMAMQRERMTQQASRMTEAMVKKKANAEADLSFRATLRQLRGHTTSGASNNEPGVPTRHNTGEQYRRSVTRDPTLPPGVLEPASSSDERSVKP